MDKYNKFVIVDVMDFYPTDNSLTIDNHPVLSASLFNGVFQLINPTVFEKLSYYPSLFSVIIFTVKFDIYEVETP